MIFEDIGSCEREYAVHLQRTCSEGGERVVPPGDVGYAVMLLGGLELSDGVNEAPRYISSSIFSMLPYLLQNIQRYNINQKVLWDWLIVTQSALE